MLERVEVERQQARRDAEQGAQLLGGAVTALQLVDDRDADGFAERRMHGGASLGVCGHPGHVADATPCPQIVQPSLNDIHPGFTWAVDVG